ncbi:hypothetical protein MTR62_06700 [Novosphingobium sp. 1949]|uniref:Uncharacterized protein n=1 Tax=Novosphingobium organovorum TaxID=2930092 RepID=A0ABT0BBF2_9SPHN|nr:hypothetical protein [Novosphingobium organovorum]MCJ2182390.1 hypothetical protein [Novosphingobium organovorum]
MVEPPPKTRPLPLFVWEKEQRARRQRMARVRHMWLRRTVLLGIGMAALGLTIAQPPLPRLVWNASASAPIGLYAVSPGTALGPAIWRSHGRRRQRGNSPRIAATCR